MYDRQNTTLSENDRYFPSKHVLLQQRSNIILFKRHPEK
jgi:hypothetical protein